MEPIVIPSDPPTNWWRRLLLKLAPRRVEHARLPSYGLMFFNQFSGEFVSLVPRSDANENIINAAETLNETYRKDPGSLTWGDLYAFERAISYLKTFEELKERLRATEARYLQLAPDGAYAQGLKDFPTDFARITETDLRARMEVLLREVYRLYMVTACKESMRSRASKIITGSMLFFFLAFGIVLVIPTQDGKSRVTTLTAVMAFGAIGGFISAQRRVQSVSKRGESVLDLIELSDLAGTFLGPVTGAVFAVVLYMLFTGNLLSGALFPSISTPADAVDKGITLDIFSQGTGPENGVAWAKLLVWSFIAGFAEKFVPDALDRLVTRAERADVVKP